MKNARFWEWINHDWVKITLQPDQMLNWSRSEPTDEGWDFVGNTWIHEGDAVVCQSTHMAQDCDGRFDRHTSHLCMLDKLHSRGLADTICGDERTEFEKTVTLPAWVENGYEQRDYSAEAMGY